MVGVSRSRYDLTCDIEDENQITRVMCSDNYDAVINAAAQIDINKCEQDPLKVGESTPKLSQQLQIYVMS